MSATCLVFLITKPNNCWNKILHCQWRTIEQKQQIKVFSQFYPPEGKRRQSFAVIRWHFCSSAPAFDVLWGRCSVSLSFKGKPNTYIPHNYFDHYPRTWRIGRKDQMISFAPEKGERKPPPQWGCWCHSSIDCCTSASSGHAAGLLSTGSSLGKIKIWLGGSSDLGNSKQELYCLKQRGRGRGRSVTCQAQPLQLNRQSLSLAHPHRETSGTGPPFALHQNLKA